MLAPLKRFKNEPLYREWLRLNDKLNSIPPETESSVAISGLQIHFSDASALLNMYDNIFLKECYRFKPSNPNPVIIDCGANIGISVIWFAKNYSGSSIMAFEPDPLLFGLLQQNVKANNIDADLRNEAVWNSTAQLKFSSSKKQNAQVSDAGAVTVKAIRLKEVLQKFSHIDLLKIDIEGAEYAVIKDCKEELPKVQHLFVEFHYKEGNMTEALSILRWIQEAGFRCSVQTPDNKTPFAFINGYNTMDVFALRASG